MKWQRGGEKDAKSKYTAGILKPIISWIEETKDPNNQKTVHHGVVDLLLFDGASNVQNAAKLASVIYPHITVVHGAEHYFTVLQGHINQNASVPMFIPVFKTVQKYLWINSSRSSCHLQEALHHAQ